MKSSTDTIQQIPWTKGSNLLGYNHIEKRVWVLQQRLHHGAVGVAVITIGALLALHDRKDWRDWFKGGL